MNLTDATIREVNMVAFPALPGKLLDERIANPAARLGSLFFGWIFAHTESSKGGNRKKTKCPRKVHHV
jgi:hypothetical protein